MPSCTLSLGEAEGRTVTTIEGLSADRNHPVQQAFVAEQAIQCGFCTPGLVMAAAALLTHNTDPTEADIKAAITNICRCGVYPRLVRTIQRAGRIARGIEPGVPLPVPLTATTPGL
jgi:isoquinoline 1-oxidoreductase alpha subunit